MKFLLDTGNVSSVASTIKSTGTTVSSIASSCSGYDTNCEDGFNFAVAKSALVTSINNIADRINATATIINNVVEAHTSLQSSLTFEGYINPKEAKEERSDSGSSGGSSSGGSSGGGYSGGGGGSYSGRSSGGAAAGVVSITKSKIKKTDTTEKEEKTKASITSMSYAVVDSKKIDGESKKLLDSNSKVGEDGYIKINNKYTIACSSKVAKVGDVLKFTTYDGKTIECVVAVNTVTEANKNKAFLLVDGDKNVKPVDFATVITNPTTKVENLGSYTKETVMPTVDATVATPVSTTNTTVTSEDTNNDATNSSSEDGGVVNG